jgi:hypothetical protein
MAETRKIMIDVEVNPSGASLGNVNKQLDETKTRVKNLKDETDKTSKSMGQGFTAGANAAALIPGPIGQAATAVVGLKGSFDAVKASLVGVRVALVATGIGAFVAIVGTLVAYFANTEKGAQSLRVAMAGLGAVVSNLIDGWLGFVKAIGSFLTLDLKGGIDNIKQSFNSFTVGLVENTAAAVNNAKALNDVAVAEGKLTETRAKSNLKITEARLIADDLNKSTEERIEAIKRAAEFEEKVAAQELKIAEQKAKILAANVAAQVDAGEEEKRIASEAAVRVYQLQNEGLKREKSLNSEIQGLKNEQDTKDKERDAARLARLKEQKEAELEAERKLAEEKAAIAESNYKIAEKRAANEQLIDEYIAERKAVTVEEQLALDIERAQKAEELKHAAVVAAITQNQADAQLRAEELAEAEDLYLRERMLVKGAIESEYYAKVLSDAEKSEADLLKVQQDANAKKVEEEKKVKQARLMVAGQVAQGLGAIGQLITQAQGEQTAASKAFAIGQLAINTAMSISEAIAGATTSATATGPGAFVATPLFIATSIATVLASVAQATAILSSAPGGGSVSTPTASSIGATSAPSFSPVTTNTTQLGNTQQAELQPVQAYVVETQITGSQANINQIESQSTFGGG